MDPSARRPHVAMATLGGTIAMRSRPGTAGAVPTLGAEDLMASIPGLADVAGVRAETLMTVPGASLTGARVVEVLGWAREAVADGADGVVVVQGTDTLEETAWLLDLWWDLPQPVALTGAMRVADAAGADGPANLLDAVRVASAPAARGLGCVVVMGGEVHAGSRVRKQHATAPAAFGSPDSGPLGRVHEGALVVRSRRRPRPLAPPRSTTGVRVALLETHLDDDGTLLRAAARDHDAVVVAGFGVGHVPAAVAVAVGDVVRRVPVVVASRTGGGSTARDTYGFEGSERDLLDRGALLSGWLDPRRARGLVWAVLSAGGSRADVARELELRGGRPE